MLERERDTEKVSGGKFGFITKFQGFDTWDNTQSKVEFKDQFTTKYMNIDVKFSVGLDVEVLVLKLLFTGKVDRIW